MLLQAQESIKIAGVSCSASPFLVEFIHLGRGEATLNHSRILGGRRQLRLLVVCKHPLLYLLQTGTLCGYVSLHVLHVLPFPLHHHLLYVTIDLLEGDMVAVLLGELLGYVPVSSTLGELGNRPPSIFLPIQCRAVARTRGEFLLCGPFGYHFIVIHTAKIDKTKEISKFSCKFGEKYLPLPSDK